jgi:hypothetical protein
MGSAVHGRRFGSRNLNRPDIVARSAATRTRCRPGCRATGFHRLRSAGFSPARRSPRSEFVTHRVESINSELNSISSAIMSQEKGTERLESPRHARLLLAGRRPAHRSSLPVRLFEALAFAHLSNNSARMVRGTGGPTWFKRRFTPFVIAGNLRFPACSKNALRFCHIMKRLRRFERLPATRGAPRFVRAAHSPAVLASSGFYEGLALLAL